MNSTDPEVRNVQFEQLGTGRKISLKMQKVKLLSEEEAMTFEQLAERWNERSAKMGREDRWAVIDGEFQKIHWDSKKPEDPNYHYLLVEGALYHTID